MGAIDLDELRRLRHARDRMDREYAREDGNAIAALLANGELGSIAVRDVAGNHVRVEQG